jgi:hypothetical protein
VTLHGPVRLRVGGAAVLSARTATRAWLLFGVLAGVRAALLRRAPFDLAARVSRSMRALVRLLAVRLRDPAALYLLLALFAVLLMIAPPSRLSRFGLWPLVYQLPGFSFIRAQTRFVVLLVLGIAVLAGTGLESLTARLRPRRQFVAAAIVIGLLIAEFAAIPLDVTAYRIDPPAVDRWVARQPKPFVIVELPLFEPDWRYQTAYMLHSTLHWQKTVHGYSGILPAAHAELYQELRNFPDTASLSHLEQLDVTYVIAHLEWFPAQEREAFEKRIMEFPDALKLEYEDATGRVYSLRKR